MCSSAVILQQWVLLCQHPESKNPRTGEERGFLVRAPFDFATEHDQTP